MHFCPNYFKFARIYLNWGSQCPPRPPCLLRLCIDDKINKDQKATVKNKVINSLFQANTKQKNCKTVLKAFDMTDLKIEPEYSDRKLHL